MIRNHANLNYSIKAQLNINKTSINYRASITVYVKSFKLDLPIKAVAVAPISRQEVHRSTTNISD